MKGHLNGVHANGYKLHKKTRRRNRMKRIYLLFLTCCCLAVASLALNLFSNGDPLVEDKQLGAKDSAIIAIDSSFYASSADDLEANSNEADWCLILVNKWNRIPENYEVELTKLKNGESVDKRIYPALQNMFDAARADGIYPVVASGYRTTKKQQSLMDGKIAEYKAEGYGLKEATEKAEAWVAIPGTSEHQLGLGVDINADGIHSIGKEVYEWLDQNSYLFGFIHRYPADKTDITGVINEPWHYRYVGMEAAAEIHKRGVCLEEYLKKTHSPN